MVSALQGVIRKQDKDRQVQQRQFTQLLEVLTAQPGTAAPATSGSSPRVRRPGSCWLIVQDAESGGRSLGHDRMVEW